MPRCRDANNNHLDPSASAMGSNMQKVGLLRPHVDGLVWFDSQNECFWFLLIWHDGDGDIVRHIHMTTLPWSITTIFQPMRE